MADRGESAVPCSLHRLLLARAARLSDYVRRKIPKRFSAIISADDVLQGVWIKAFRSFPQFQVSGPDSLDRWLFTLTDHELIDAIRWAERGCRSPQEGTEDEIDALSDDLSGVLNSIASPDFGPSREAAHREATEIIRKALDHLPAEQCLLVRMAYLEGRSVSEIARILGQQVNPIRHQLATAREALRRRLGRAGRFFTDVISADEPIRAQGGPHEFLG